VEEAQGHGDLRQRDPFNMDAPVTALLPGLQPVPGAAHVAAPWSETSNRRRRKPQTEGMIVHAIKALRPGAGLHAQAQ
jgi:hypothetical protein